MYSRFAAAISAPTQTVSDVTSNIHSTFTDTYNKAVNNPYFTDTYNKAVNNPYFTDTYNKAVNNPYFTDTKSTITSTFNDSTNYISSIPSSIGSKVTSYTSMFQPVNPDEEETSRTHPSRNLANNEVEPLNDDKVRLVNDILDLYSLKFSSKCFEHYAENATFSDPLMHTTGIQNIRAQFYAMPKIFVRSSTVSYTIVENSFDTLKIDLNQKYILPYVNRAVTHNSVIVLELDQDKKIIKHTDLWGGKPIGKEVILPLRKGAAKLLSTLVKVPSSEVPEDN